MKGIVFTYLEEFVANSRGIEAWDSILENTELETEDGIYVAPGNYPDTDFVALVATAAKITEQPVDDVVFAFGEFVLIKFHEDYGHFFKEGMTAKTFLLGVHDVIHVEVKKLYPDVTLPKFTYEDASPNKLVMIYNSPRNLCFFAKGLIAQVGRHFNETITLEEPECSLHGAENCRLELTFQS